MEALLFEHLKDQVPLAGRRVYAIEADPETSPPYIVYRRVSAARDYTHDGYSSLTRARIQIMPYAETFDEMRDIVEEIDEALEGWDEVQATFKDNDLDRDRTESGLFTSLQDWIIWFTD